jgi:hypothetical protein
MALRLITLICGQCLDRAQVIGSVVLCVDHTRVWIPNVHFVVEPLEDTIATVAHDGDETGHHRTDSLTGTCAAHGRLSVTKTQVRAWIADGRTIEKIGPPRLPSVRPAA